MLIGYARVSTQDQNLNLQRTALEQVGCQKIYEDQMGGARSYSIHVDVNELSISSASCSRPTPSRSINSTT